jgi:hypothetical protein
MHSPLSRTSITEDEAVAILLGWTTGPIECECSDEAEGEEYDCYVFCLREALENDMTVPESEYVMAKHEKQPAHVIAEKLAAVQRQEAITEQANVYLCAIRDELNKGEQSMLRKDLTLSNAAHTLITRHSFNEWVKSISAERMAGPADAAVPAELMQAPNEGEKKQTPRRRQLDQEEAILAAIREQEHDPMALPNFVAGKDGVRAATRDALRASPLFKGSTVFDKAWERLGKQKLIAYRADRPPPKKSVGDTTEGG